MVTGIKQRLSMFNAAEAMNKGGGKNDGFKWLIEGMKAVGYKSHVTGFQTEEIIEFVHTLDPTMATRSKNMDREIRDMTKTLKPFRGKSLTVKEKNANIVRKAMRMLGDTDIKSGDVELDRDMIKEMVFWWVRQNDMAAVYPIWMGAYLQAHENKLNGIKDGMDLAEAQRRAADYAAFIISTSQPNAAPVDQAWFQSLEGAWRVLILAMTWRLKAGNRMMWYGKAAKRGPLNKKDLVRHFMMEWWLPAATTMMIPAMLYDSDDKPEWYEFMGSQAATDMLGWIPIVSDTINVIRFGKQGIPAAEGLIRIGKTWNKASSGKYLDAAFELIRTMEWFAGIPVTNIPVDLYKMSKKISGD